MGHGWISNLAVLGVIDELGGGAICILDVGAVRYAWAAGRRASCAGPTYTSHCHCNVLLPTESNTDALA
jgi:hypothetical protein